MNEHEPNETVANINSLVLEHLRAIRADVADIKDRLTSVEIQISAMGQQLGALTTAVYSGRSEMEGMKQRIDRLERRLELREAA